MRHFPRATALLLAMLAAGGCVSSSLLLHVFPDGHGRATITTRVYVSSLAAFDSLFPGVPQRTINVEEELPALSQPALDYAFGTAVRLVSTSLEPASDGGVRTTIVDFDDVSQLRLRFPPVFSVPSGGSLADFGLTSPPLVTFAMKAHDNGDRLLIVGMPQGTMNPGPDPEMTVFKTDSPEEQIFKRALKGVGLRLFVELDADTPLLRTNAPDNRGNRATILDLDLDSIINNLDEEKLKRAMNPGSVQELLWQLDDLPGAVVPKDREVWLEFEPPREPQQQPAPARPAAPQGPPPTEIYLAPMKTAGGAIEIGTPIDITNSPGYDNQPVFTPDGRSVLFTSVRGRGVTQSDIYRYDIASKQIARVTDTPESEYSPTITPSGALSVIRVELDGQNTQRLWQFTAGGRDPNILLENVKPVGYHAWADARTVALFILGAQGQPATLQVADTQSGTTRTVATDIGRSIQRMPGTGTARSISFVQRERHGSMVHLTIKALDAATLAVTTLTPAVGSASEADVAWTPDGTLLMAASGKLFAWRRGQPGWKEIASLERLSLSGVSRLAVSPSGDYLALVASSGQRR